MKRLTALFLAVVILLSLSACRKAAKPRSEASPEVQQALEQLPEAVFDPVGKLNAFNNLKELNKACGSEIVTPESWTVTNELFEATKLDGNEIGQYVFTADGLSCAVRFCSDIYTDASGVSGYNGDSIFESVKGDVAFAENCILGRWNTNAGQYVLIVATQDIIEFNKLFDELKDAIPG